MNDRTLFMDGNQLRKKLENLGISQTTLAKLLGVTPRAVTLWLAGDRAVPSPVASYLRLFSFLTPNLKQVELSTIEKLENKMREGIYGIEFISGDGYGDGILIFESGQIYGTDSGSVKYDGSYTYDSITKNVRAELKITIPPNVESVFGVTNPYEWAFDVIASFSPINDSGPIAVKTSLGVEIVAKFLFLRTLPSVAA